MDVTSCFSSLMLAILSVDDDSKSCGSANRYYKMAKRQDGQDGGISDYFDIKLSPHQIVPQDKTRVAAMERSSAFTVCDSWRKGGKKGARAATYCRYSNRRTMEIGRDKEEQRVL